MTFQQAIQSRVLLLDGAMGTMLQESGALHPGECPELLNATRPMDVLDIHLAYIDAGADIITANTFGASPLRLSRFDLADRMGELMQSAIALCREAVSGRERTVFVAASVGPTGELYRSDAGMPERMYRSFFEQCAAAEAAGADLILIETMSDICEARLALIAARAACSLPALCSFTLEPDDNTYAGNPPEVLALCCAKLGAALTGVNCGFGPEELFLGYSRLAGASMLPTFACPNAGLPQNGKYMISPAAMAKAMEPYLHGGASAIGGCCGTTPKHIQTLRTLLDDCHGHARRASADRENICSAAALLPLSALEPYTTIALAGLSHTQAEERIRQQARQQQVLHIDFTDWGRDAIRALIWEVSPYIRMTPLAFHVQNAEQAHAALFAYPGIAAVYAHGDAYRVLKAAVRYGAEVIS